MAAPNPASNIYFHFRLGQHGIHGVEYLPLFETPLVLYLEAPVAPSSCTEMATEVDNPELRQRLQELEHEFEVSSIVLNAICPFFLVLCHAITAGNEMMAVAWI